MDIKPSNILITSDTQKYAKYSRVALIEQLLSDRMTLRLSDFGLCCPADEIFITEGDSKYCSYELIGGTGPFDLTKADTFSLGLTLYELMMGRTLTVGDAESGDELSSVR